MPGVSSRAPVSGEYGVGKVYLKFKPRKIRKFSFAALIVYFCFGSMMFFMYAWPKPDLRYGVIVPFLRRACSGFDYVFNFKFESSDVVVNFDRFGVPFLVGSDLSRVVYLQGYAHAADRLSQMDVLRRTATGRLSELYGNRTIELDKQSLTLNFHNIAVRDLEMLDDEDFGLLLSYANGVNKFIDESASGTLAALFASIPVEYLHWIGFSQSYKHPHVEKWEPVHTLAVMRLLSYQWSSGWEELLVSSILGSDAVTDDLSTIIPSLSGNSFVVSGKHTRSGSAILASDFHAQISSEGLWYQNSLEVPSMHVSGASIPGVPLVLVGRNEHISWTFTPSSATTDELIQVDDEAAGVQFTTRQEAVKVSGNGTEYFVEVDIQQALLPSCDQVVPSVVDLVTPRVRAYLATHNPGAGALRMVSPSLQKSMNLQFFKQLNAARSRQDFLSACASQQAMSLTVLYADIKGHIGYALTAPSPFKDATDSEIGEVKSEFDPPSGYFVSASGPVTGGQSRLESLVMAQVSTHRLTLEEAQKVFMDEFSPSSLLLLDLSRSVSAIDIKPFDDDVQQSVALFMNLTQSFDGVYSVDGVAPTLLEAFRSALLDNVVSGSNHPLSQQFMEGAPKVAAMMRHQSGQTGAEWVLEVLRDRSTAEGSSSAAALIKAFRLPSSTDSLIVYSLHEAVSWCRTHYGKKEEGWQWGKVHSALYLHPSVPKFYLYDTIWSRGPHPISGGVDSLLNTQYVVDNAIYDRGALWHTNSFGSSLRLVVEAGIGGKVFASSPTGQSNNIGSPRYQFNSAETFLRTLLPEEGICHDAKCIMQAVPGYCTGEGRSSRVCSTPEMKNSEL